MRDRSPLIVSALVSIVVSSCSEPFGAEGLTSSDHPIEAAAQVDISGDWEWTHFTFFVIPTDVAQSLVPMEHWHLLRGPVTRIECDVSGTMMLTQTGSAFSGPATQTATCRTHDVPDFTPPAFVFAPTFDVDNGQITGHAFQFEVLPLCLNLGSIVEVQNGTAMRWRATGKCDIPIPVHPAVAKTSWEAVRVPS